MKTNSKFFFGYKKKLATPKTAQDTIPFIEFYDNGIFLTGENTFSVVFAFDNLDYQFYRDEEKNKVLENYKKMLNSLPIDVSYQEFLLNKNPEKQKYHDVLIPKIARNSAEIHDEYCRMMEGNIHKSSNAASDKILLAALSYSPQGTLNNSETLFKFYNQLKEKFAVIGTELRLLEPEQVFEVLFEYYHMFDNLDFRLPKNIYKSGLNIRDVIAPSVFDFSKGKYVRIGNHFTRIMCVQSYDTRITDEFIYDILDNNKRIAGSKHIRRIDKGEALKNINKAIKAINGKISSIQSKNKKDGTTNVSHRYIEKAKALTDKYDELSKSESEYFEIGIFVSISAATLEDLDAITLDIKGKERTHQVKLDTLIGQQALGLDTMLPFATNKFSEKAQNNINIKQMTEMVGTLIPFSAVAYYSENGLYYGRNTMTSSLIILDRTEEMNSNGFTLGSSGSGKSMSTKSELIDAIEKYPNDEFIILDPENEYKPLVQYFDGEILSISASSKTKMNIFDVDLSFVENGVDAITTKVEFILTFCESTLGRELQSAERTIIDRVTKEIYADFRNSNGDPEKLPTLIDFYNALKKQTETEAKTLALAIEIYAIGNIQTFTGKTNIDIKKKFLVIDIFEMGEQLQTVGIQVVLEFMWQRVMQNKKRGVRTWVWVDEFSMLFNNEKSAVFFSKVFKRIRKHGGVATGITQNISEVFDNKNATTMFQNSEFFVILQQKTNDLKKLVDFFELSPSQAANISNGKRGTGLIICGKKVIPFKKILPGDNLIYKICSTKFSEKQAEIAGG